MADPLLENIAANLLTLLNGVTTGNGYNQTLSVVRSKRTDWSDVYDRTPKNGNGLLYLVNLERMEAQGDDLQEDYTTARWTATFNLEVYVIESDDDTAVDTLINRVIGDVYKKIMTDPDLTGKTWDTVVSEVTRITGGPEYSGVLFTIEVPVRHDIADPYTQV
tara:strand:+ start:7346 stop:7834 length:489 start_codon:yes stop_codon:yes gene_type:complete